jgi:DNA primase
MGGKPVAFQARTMDPKPTKPKYLTSRHGPKEDPKSECFRPASAILYNYDRIPEGGEIVLVEGAGDVMGWHRGNLARTPVAAAMLGVSLTPEKLGLLIERRPSQITLAADAEPEAQKQAAALLADMLDNDLPARLGSWEGGKDAGSGAALVERPSTLLDADLARLR